MPTLQQDTKEEIVRLLGYPQWDTLTEDQIAWLGRDYTISNVQRISIIINAITKQPDLNEECPKGGIDYQLDNAGIDSNIVAMDKVAYDHTGMVKILNFTGFRLIRELANIVKLPIYFNRYSVRNGGPRTFVSYPN